MEVTSGFKTRSVVLLFRFGSESGAIDPKIVSDGTGKNVAAVPQHQELTRTDRA
jgi:hypothetical protein